MGLPMQPSAEPAPAAELAPAPAAPTRPPPSRLRLTVDQRNGLLILGGVIALLLILPPQHEYPIIDDWIYAGATRTLVATGVFQMPSMSQANLVGQSLWGVPWVKLFGFSFTVLTYSTLVLAVAGLLAFYGIARA